MKSRYELDENDIKKAIAAYVTSTNSANNLRIKTVEINVEPTYGIGMNDGQITGHSISATVEGDRIKEVK